MILDKLINCRIAEISRVCDLICIRFISPNKKEISLHVQSFLRFLNGDKILVCSDDMYRCLDGYDSESFEWDVPGKSVYDLSLKNSGVVDANSTVIKCEKNSAGDLKIIFSDGMILQIIVNTVEKEEKYRIFDNTETFVLES